MATPQEKYAEYISLVRDGVTPIEPLARKLADENHLPIGPLEAAMEQACSRLIKMYIREIREGRVDFAEDAYLLARERNYPTAEIDAALSLAPKTHY